jgi:hypothetical protein
VVELSTDARGFAHLRVLDALQTRLAEIVGRPVDVIEEPVSSSRVQEEIDRDRIRAF